MAATTLALPAQAHRVGLSRGEYRIHGAEVTSTLTFAKDELATMDGANGTSLTEVGRTIASGVQVTMGGARCTAELESARPAPPDGVELVLRHACASGGPVSLRYDFVDALEVGHRHIVEVKEGTAASTFVAYRGNETLEVARGADEATRSFAGLVRLGVEHVLTGWDHLAFLLGVALVAFRRGAVTERRKLRELALAVTAFTIAHSATLAASVFGVFPPNVRWVEPLIALSIAYVGLEGLLAAPRSSLHTTTFTFGLVHGMGFAGALREIAIPRASLPAALAGFNVGVELGQLVALVPAVVVLTWLASRPAWLPRVVRVASAALAITGALVSVARGAAEWKSAHVARSKDDAHGIRAVATAGQAAPGPADAERLCAAVHELPRRRRAECEHVREGVVLATTCTAKLSAAVASGALTLSSGAVDACVAEQSARFATCEFVSAPPGARPRSCERVARGSREEGAACRSSLECVSGLFCDGAGPLDAGVCRLPKTDGEACGTAIDPLASYVPNAAETEHRECRGECIQYRCRSARVAVVAR